MLNKKTIFELSAPDKRLNFGSEAQTETTTGDVVTCSLCNGEGGQYIDSRCYDFDYEKNNGQGYYKACKICKGSGKVKPVITVDWQTAGEIKPEYINSF